MLRSTQIDRLLISARTQADPCQTPSIPSRLESDTNFTNRSESKTLIYLINYRYKLKHNCKPVTLPGCELRLAAQLPHTKQLLVPLLVLGKVAVRLENVLVVPLKARRQVVDMALCEARGVELWAERWLWTRLRTANLQITALENYQMKKAFPAVDLHFALYSRQAAPFSDYCKWRTCLKRQDLCENFIILQTSHTPIHVHYYLSIEKKVWKERHK